MTTWTGDELTRIGSADELQLASVKRDGTLREPVTMWAVRRGDDVYVRAFKGRTSPWFRGALVGKQGRIRAGGIEKDVRFVEPDPSISDDLDAAYRSKYRRYGARYVDPMVTPEARAATLELLPRA